MIFILNQINMESNPQQRRTYSQFQTNQPNQYSSDYQTQNYQPYRPPMQGLPFANSQAGQNGLYTISNQQTNYSASQGQIVRSGSRVKTEANPLVSSHVTNEQVVKGQSRISYVPYEKKVVDYKDRTYIQRVPIKKKAIRYEERRQMETVPKEVTKTEYYAVEKRIQYQKQIIPEKKIEMVMVEKKVKRFEYVPVEKQIVHYPENIDVQTAKSQSRVVLRDQGINVKTDAEYRAINPALIYNYSAQHQGRDQHIGYVDQGTSRVLSTAPTHPNYPVYEYQPQQHTTYRSGPVETNNSYRHTPFQNLNSNSRATYIDQSSPGVYVTGPSGSNREQMPPSRGSYISELNTFNQPRQEGGIRPFQRLNQSRTKAGISHVKRQSQYNDYGNVQGGNERQNDYDWRIEK